MSTATRPFMRRRGLVLFMALALMGLAAAVITETVGQASIEINRTAAAGDDAQLSQLLISAATVAREAARAGDFSDKAVPTPLGKITLTWEKNHACTIDAEAGAAKRSVTVSAVRQ